MNKVAVFALCSLPLVSVFADTTHSITVSVASSLATKIVSNQVNPLFSAGLDNCWNGPTISTTCGASSNAMQQITVPSTPDGNAPYVSSDPVPVGFDGPASYKYSKMQASMGFQLSGGYFKSKTCKVWLNQFTETTSLIFTVDAAKDSDDWSCYVTGNN